MKRLKKNALMVRHAGKLGATTCANRPTMIEKGTIYEHVRLVDKQNSYVRIGNMLYMAKNKDLMLQEAKEIIARVAYKNPDGGCEQFFNTRGETDTKKITQTALDFLNSHPADKKIDYIKKAPKIIFINHERGQGITRMPFSLKEQSGAPPVPQSMADFAPIPQKNVSLDQVIDRYIVRYERESIPQTAAPGPGPIAANAPSPETTLAETRSLRTFMSMLFEQDTPPPPPEEEELPPDDAAPPGDDMGAPTDDAGAGGGAGAPEGAPVVNTPKINLNEFSRSVARMINNYDALLNPRSIIMNRVEAYIQSNYDERTAKMFIQIMERNYGLHTTNTEYTSTGGGGEFPSPAAANAGGEGEQLAGGGAD